MRISDWSSDVCSSDLAVGDAVEVAVDVAGVGLGLCAGVDVLAAVLHQVVEAFGFEGLGGSEGDVLRAELVTAVVGREAGAPAAEGTGDHEGNCAHSTNRPEEGRGGHK